MGNAAINSAGMETARSGGGGVGGTLMGSGGVSHINEFADYATLRTNRVPSVV